MGKETLLPLVFIASWRRRTLPEIDPRQKTQGWLIEYFCSRAINLIGAAPTDRLSPAEAVDENLHRLILLKYN